MASVQNALSATELSRFYPLDSISPNLMDQLKQDALVTYVESGACIIKAGIDNGLNHYLLDGELELRLSFNNRQPIFPDDSSAKHCLEKSIQNGGMIKASSRAKILCISRTKVEQLIEKTQRTTAENDKLHDSVNKKMVVEEEVDWSQYFIQTGFAANLNASQLHQLFTELTSIPVQKGEILFNYGSQADRFYILKKGAAVIKTDPSGYYRGKKITINEGYFLGDEAIIADTCRNATVKMLTDGEVGYLEREAFERIVKPALLQAYTEDVKIQRKHKETTYIDIRLNIEYQESHYPDCLNIPIGQLRGKLSTLKQGNVYLIAPVNDIRSRLATYLLRQAGFEAYYMID